MLIKEVKAGKIRDSRGDFTIEVSVNGSKASSPNGKSKGRYETPSYHNSLNWNVKSFKNLKPNLANLRINSFDDLKKIENAVKKTFKLKNAKSFGANALFALESAVLKALAKEKRKELWQIINPNAKRFPVPLGNAIGGGMHSSNKGHAEFQEFLVIPNSSSIKENVKIMNSVHNQLKSMTNSKAKNDEGAWQTLFTNEQILEILSEFRQIRAGIDVASSSFYKNGFYNYADKKLNSKSQADYINMLIKKFNLFYVEDPVHENDFSSFGKISKNALVCGDDLTVTNIQRLEKAIKNNSINCMIIKPNQNGSLLELKKIFEICKKHNIKTVLSHRSGETLDSALADYAFGFQADFIKTGISTKWRQAKLKRLIEIENSFRK